MNKIAVGLVTGYLILGCTSPETASSSVESGTPTVPIPEVGQVLTAEEAAALIEKVGIAEDAPPTPTRISAELEALHREIAAALLKYYEATAKAKMAESASFEVAMKEMLPDFRAALKKVMKIKDREAREVARDALFKAASVQPEAMIVADNSFDIRVAQKEVIDRMREERVASWELIQILRRYAIRLEKELRNTGGLNSWRAK